MQRDDTVATLGVGEGDTVHMILLQTGGKPVIYLMPPAGSEVEASVKLSLVSEWDFSAFYPVVPSTRSLTGGLGESLEWNVKTFPDGTLLEKNTGLEVSYLFWEAESVYLVYLALSGTLACLSLQSPQTHGPGNLLSLRRDRWNCTRRGDLHSYPSPHRRQ